MANYFDFEYDKKSDPKEVIVWEQNYDTGEVEERRFPVKDYLYFYVDALDQSKADPVFKSQRDTFVQKLTLDTFKEFKDGAAAKRYREMGLNTYESDISPLLKVMLDNYGLDNQKAPGAWNLALYDIETDVMSDQSFADMRSSADREINAVSVWYSKPNKFYNFTLVPPMLRDVWNYDHVEERGNFTICYFRTEAEVLESFFEVTKAYETIALGAWNGDFFDTGYIFERAKRIWGEKGAAKRMGRFERVRKTKIERGEEVENIIRPIGIIWYDCLEAYKKNGPELESFALNAVVEEELGTSKLEFDGSFEDLYHGTRKERARFDEITPAKKKLALLKQSEDKFSYLVDELYDQAKAEVLAKDNDYIEAEIETRTQIAITDKLEEMFEDQDFLNELGEDATDYERFFLFKKFKDTYRLFLDYSNQDSQLLYDLEMKLDKFKTLMMLAQYNVSYFHDVFTTLRQVEQGITNFAHINDKRVVIDREYDKRKQVYNQHIDPDLLNIRINNDYRIRDEDSPKIKEYKALAGQPKIPGAHVLLPNIGLISFDDEKTPPLARRFRELKARLKEINAQLAEIEDSEED